MPLLKYAAKDHSCIFFIAGPCVIESEKLCLHVAERLAALSRKHRVDIIFKASYDKANRTSQTSFRGPGLKAGLAVLAKVRQETGLPVLTDVHTSSEATLAGTVVDILQIPAFLCRQTDLLRAAAKTRKTVNIKKGQFMAPGDMGHAINKAGKNVWLTERGTFFGYNRLVVDYTGLIDMRKFGKPVIFDATHSVQQPGGAGGQSSGNRDLAIPLARAAVSVGVDGLFFEVHPDPSRALCDKDNSLYLHDFEREMPRLIELHQTVRVWK